MVGDLFQNSTENICSTSRVCIHIQEKYSFNFNKNIHTQEKYSFNFNKNIHSYSTKIFIQLQQKYSFNFNINIHLYSTEIFIQQKYYFVFKLKNIYSRFGLLRGPARGHVDARITREAVRVRGTTWLEQFKYGVFAR